MSDKVNPTHMVKFLRKTESKKSYPVNIGAAFKTDKGNIRLNLNVIPAASELREGVLILTEYQEKDAKEQDAAIDDEIPY